MQWLLPPKLVAILVLAMVGVTLAVPAPTLAWPIRLVGLIPLAGGMAINVRHAQLFDTIGTNIKTFNDPNTLVRGGAFRWTRNPMYLGFALMLIGAAALCGSAISWVGPAIFIVAADRWYIPFEEQRMEATFGDEYNDYRAQVRRWVGAR